MKKTLNFENWIKDKLGKNFTFSNKLLNSIEDVTRAPFDTHEEVIRFNSIDMYPDNYLYFGDEILSHLSPAEFEDLNSLWQEEIDIARDNGSDIVFGFKDKLPTNSSVSQLELGDIIKMNTRDYVIRGVYFKDNEISYKLVDKELNLTSTITDKNLRQIKFINSGISHLEFKLKRQKLPITLESYDKDGEKFSIIEKLVDLGIVIYKTDDGQILKDFNIENINGNWRLKSVVDFDGSFGRDNEITNQNTKVPIKNELSYGLKDAFKDEKVLLDLFDDLFRPNDFKSASDDSRNKQQDTSKEHEEICGNYDIQNMYLTEMKIPDFLSPEQRSMFSNLSRQTEIIDLTPKNKTDKSSDNVIVLGTTIILNNMEYVCTGIKSGFASDLYYTLKDKYGLCQYFNEYFLLMRFSNGELRIENTVPKIEEVKIPLTIGKDEIRSKYLNNDNKPIYVGQSREYTLEEINKFLGETNKQRPTPEEVKNKQILKVFDIVELPMGTYTCSSITIEKDTIIYWLDSHDYESEFLTPFSKDTLEALNYNVSENSIYNQKQIGDCFTINEERKRIVEINKDFTYKADDDNYYGFDEVHSIGLEDSLCLEKLTKDNIKRAKIIINTLEYFISDSFAFDGNYIYPLEEDGSYDMNDFYILEYND